MDAAKYRDVTAPELGYLQLTAADLRRLHQQDWGGRKTFWNKRQEIQKSLTAFSPIVTNPEPVPA